jgi:DNA processing protein
MNDYDIWFILLDISNKMKIKLIDRFKNAKEIWYYTLNEKNISKTKAEETWKMVEGLKQTLFNNKINFVTKMSEDYPSKLKNYDDAPYVLFYKGDIKKLNTCKNVSIVGSRKCSSYGINVTKQIVEKLSTYNINIISGMARGIDYYAHFESIKQKNFTCAILGSGVDVVYPKENIRLYNDIIEKGCVISQFLPGTKPFHYNFPIRNRIIGGLSEITIVVEAGLKSGSQITANAAIEMGNDVVAVPGSVLSKYSMGTNSLIKDGAFPFTNIKDIFDLLGINYNIINKPIIRKMTIAEEKIYKLINNDPIHIDDIVKITDIDISQIYGLLFEMQLNDEIMCLSGNYYVRANNLI